jgi:hypothetical protein
METEFSFRMAESTSNYARNDQIMNMDDVQVKLNKHLERVENKTINSLENNKDVWNIIEEHSQTWKEEKTNKLMHHVSEMYSSDVHANQAGVYEVKDTKEGQHLSDLDSHVFSLTGKVDNFVQCLL